MRTPTKRRARQLALVTLAAPVAAWALEQGAHRAEARDKTSPTSRRLRWSRAAGRPAQAAAGHHRHLETATAATRPAPWSADGRSRSAGSVSSLLPRPQGQATQSGAPAPTAYLDDPGAGDRFLGWPHGRPALVGNANLRRGRAPAPFSTGPLALSWRYP
jgi:hypothetical protein